MFDKVPSLAHPLVRKFIGFALVGVFGTAAHYSVLTALVELGHVPVLIATTAGFTVGALVNYFLSRRFVFASDAAHSVALPRFLAVAIVGATINWLVVAWLVGTFPIHYLIAQLCATGAVLFWNFAVNHFWTFRK